MAEVMFLPTDDDETKKPVQKSSKRPAFEVDDRLTIQVNHSLSNRVGDVLVRSQEDKSIVDKQILALGLSLRREVETDNRSHTPVNRPDGRRPSFEVDDRVEVRLDFDLGMRVADILLDTQKVKHNQDGMEDKQIVALGFHLRSFEDKDESHKERKSA